MQLRVELQEQERPQHHLPHTYHRPNQPTIRLTFPAQSGHPNRESKRALRPHPQSYEEMVESNQPQGLTVLSYKDSPSLTVYRKSAQQLEYAEQYYAHTDKSVRQQSYEYLEPCQL
jgi:hypothetical protein